MTIRKIAYQGEPGANSHIACQNVYPGWEALPFDTFEDALGAVAEGEAQLGMIPIENSIAGRVADIHHLLPSANLHVVGEYFLPIHFQLLGLKGAKLGDIKSVYSHVHALGQCRKIIRKLKLSPHVAADTAGSAREVAEWGDPAKASIATSLAGAIYGLDVLAENIEDEPHNTTRFVILSKAPHWAKPSSEPTVTTFVFRVRNVPAALYKALGGLRDERRQHDQARKLYGRGGVHRDAVSGRRRRPPRRAGARARPGGAGVFLQGAEDSRRLSGASVQDRDPGAGERRLEIRSDRGRPYLGHARPSATDSLLCFGAIAAGPSIILQHVGNLLL